MQNTLIIIRYGEIALKSKKTRTHFESILISNISNALKHNNTSFKIKKEWGRIFLYTDQIEESINILQKIFGIISISPAVETTSIIDDISKLSIDLSKTKISNETSFALRVTRTGQHDFTSQDVAIKVGKILQEKTNSTVDLSNPDYELFIEIRQKNSYLFTEKIPCTTGMPLGTQGCVLSLIDSPFSFLSSWYLMKRGCIPVFILTDKNLLDSLKSFCQKWYTNPDIHEQSNDEILLEKLNFLIKNKKCDALVTSFYFSPSESTSNLIEFTKNLNIPILHPLISMDENEIKQKSNELGVII